MLPDTARLTPAVAGYVNGVRDGNRALLARAITLVESTKAADLALAQQVLQVLLPI